MGNPMAFLKEYYRRKSWDTELASAKKSNGWQVWQRRHGRIATVIMCRGSLA